MITLTTEQARKLFLIKQHLVGDKLQGSFNEKVISLVRDIGFIQWDPVTTVAPSHLITLWSRIGRFEWNELENLMWDTKEIFLHWAPIAFLVLTEDYPIYHSLMLEYPDSLGKAWRSHIEPARKFLESHAELQKKLIEKLSSGPIETATLNNLGKKEKSVDGWSTGNEVTRLLIQLNMRGKVIVSGHVGNQNIWSLTDDFLPKKTQRKHLSVEDLEEKMAIRSLKALGVASDFDINRYFVRGRYRKQEEVIENMVSRGIIQNVRVNNQKGRRKYYILPDDLKLIENLDREPWEGNIKLISPFDNIISTRERAEKLFNFKYSLEQFVPKEKRVYGTYVLPILWQDKLVGRIDAKMDKVKHVLNIIAIYSEPGLEKELKIPQELSELLNDFAGFLGAESISYGSKMPDGWKKTLKN